MFRYQQLIKDNLKEVAKLITTEQGKTLADAEGDVMRGLQVRAGRTAVSAASRANKTIALVPLGCGEPVCQHLPDAGGDPDWDQQGHGPHQLQSAPGSLCRHCPLQLSCHDSFVDVPHRWPIILCNR